MRTWTARHAWIGAILATAALAAGCGGGSGGESIADAKKKLVDSCHKGHEADAGDLKLCQCIAAKLESQQHYTKAKQFDDVRKAVESGTIPAALRKASAACPHP